MKRKYSKPNMSIDIFEANEYIATCARAVCNINVSNSKNKNVAYRDRNKMVGYQKEDRRFYRSNSKCNHEFIASDVTKLIPYMHDSNGTDDGGTIQQVYYWSEGNNSHFTTGYTETGSSV